MTNTARMTNMSRDAMRAELVKCAAVSNMYFDRHRWALSEQWHLKAVAWQKRIDALDTLQDRPE